MERGKGKGNACRKNPIRFVFISQRFSVNPITLAVINCQCTYKSKSGTRQGAKTRLNLLVDRPVMRKL